MQAKNKNKARGTGRPLLGFFLGLLFGITVTVIAGVSVYFAEKKDADDDLRPDCNLPLAKPDFLSACSCRPARNPDILASVHLLTPAWSEILANEDSLQFKEQALTTEDVVDHILGASDLKDVYDRSVVTSFRPEGYGLQADLELYFANVTAVTPDQVEHAFQTGHQHVGLLSHSYVENVDPLSFSAVPGPGGKQPVIPRREIPIYRNRPADFLATLGLVEPRWSGSLAELNSTDSRELAVRLENLTDAIFKASGLETAYNYTVVMRARESPEGRVLVDLELYLKNSTGWRPTEVESSFQQGYAALERTDLIVLLRTLNSSCFQVRFDPSRAPKPIDDNLCGMSRLYPNGQSARIVGGTPTEWYGVYPWVVMLTYQRRHLCGGALWDSQHVLTAAHCITGAPHLDDKITVNTSHMEIIAGKWLYGFDADWAHSQTVRVEGAMLHRDYDRNTYENDIAVLRLEHPLELNQVVEPICHPARDTQLPTEGVVVGWGTTREQSLSHPDQLMEATLNLYGQTDCEHVFGSWFDNGDITRFLHEGMFCAAKGIRGGHDACEGDSGGPLFAHIPGQQDQWTMIGIISNGYGCGRVGDPGFYTFVPHYVGWIADSIGVLRALANAP